TAYYGLRDLAGLKAGERVLIHAAAGGVGMAAVQLARLWGADVYATASPAKWPTLRAMGLDDDHIANSRTLDFHDTFHTHTHGHGMDVILGSLAGDHVNASLDLLAPTGRYIEMGKTDIRDPADIHTTHPGRTYRAFDLKEAGPERTQAMLTEITQHLTQHRLTLLPRTDWHLADLPAALRHMSQGRHTGKNVIHIPTPLNPHGTTLITGGTGTLATLLARHLTTHHHTRHLHLLSRQGPHHPHAHTLRQQLLDLGAETVTITACDVTDPHALAATLDTIPDTHPLTAVIHTAGTLHDATLTTLTPDQLHTVLATKADAAHHLHHHTRHHNLAAFVLYSSVAGHLGSPGQANYAAANTFLDALATHRHTHHQPATSLAWGLWAQASGMTAHLNTQDLARMNRTAIQPLTNTTALQLFDAQEHFHRPVRMICNLDTEHLPAQPVFSRLATVRRTAETAQQGPALTDRLAGLTPAEQREHLLTLIRQQAAQILTLDHPTAIDPQRGFLDQGLDSLTAVELRNRLSTATGIRLPATTIFDHPTPNALTDHLHTQLAPDTA
ncbi:SDR family NAD(P)-dependent oxidoreductase, partial [Streptomyces sp. CC219B]|uniref:SDR family NAD(P)-dependent oxidoreductase n=1 Tax=Streptomyces sp. CC219B TaxID=3044574 RepID=UPI0024A86452